jgi:membrane-bound lytic murein transglycosylase A
MYFVPKQSDVCGNRSDEICAKFWKEVKMEGTGILNNGNLLRYNGKQEKSPANCDARKGFVMGAAGCLIPFFSVAADPRVYPAGTIIYVEGMEGKMIKMPDGRTVRHPGYFIVQDVGSAIKGKGRFDFFTGTRGPNDAQNAFGFKSPFSMTDKNKCDKAFTVIPYGRTGGTTSWAEAKRAIEEASGTGAATRVRLASANSTGRRR